MVFMYREMVTAMTSEEGKLHFANLFLENFHTNIKSKSENCQSLQKFLESTCSGQRMVSMLRVAIVEDDELYAKQLGTYLQQFEEEYKEQVEITYFTDGDQIVQKYQSQNDIILMGIEMKFVNGMTAAEKIRKMDSEVVIIFITNMAQYAIRGYAVDDLDYVLKPVSYFAFSQKLVRVLNRMKKERAKRLS